VLIVIIRLHCLHIVIKMQLIATDVAHILLYVVIIIIITKPQAEILTLNKVSGCNDVSFSDHSVLEGDRIPPLKSHRQALEKELCFPGVLSHNCDAPANLLRHFYGCLMPCTCCFYGKQTEDVGAGLLGVLVRLALCCSVSCCTWCDRCAAMRLGISVWYCHVPGHRLAFGPWQQSGPIWPFVVISDQAHRFLGCWYLSPFECPPDDVIQLTMTLLSGGTSAAG